MSLELNLDWSRPYLMRDRPELLTDKIAGSGFYMFLWQNKPLYIGQAYYESIRRRITSHRSYTDRIGRWVYDHGVSIEEIEFKVAYFVSDDKTLYDDIECLLIFSAKPILPGHEECKNIYHGRKIKIYNKGKYEPLKPEIESPFL